MITIESLSKSFGENTVLENLNLEVKGKEIVCLLGPNGCGKTTLLNMISGLIEPDQGRILIDGVVVSGKTGSRKVHIAPSERKIGYLFQTIALFPNMRIQDNVAFGLKAAHFPSQDVKARTKQLLEFVGLCDFAQYYPSQLSGGMKQRAALARSLATEPKVLLLDEPVSAIDPQLRESFRLELKSYLRKLEITVIYVTHNLSEAFVMSDRVAIMGNKGIEQIGGCGEIFDKPRSSYVAQFLGLNVFRGKAQKMRGDFLELDVSGLCVFAAANVALEGKNVIATLKPEEITLTKAEGIKSKERNILKGKIGEMTVMRSTAQVTLDVGFALKVRLQLSTLKSLALTVGDEVNVCFSSEALNVFADN